MKGVFDLTLLLVHVYLSHCCYQEAQIAFCPTIPEDFRPGLSTLVLTMKDVREINSTVLHDADLSSVTKLSISDAGVTGIAQGAFSSFQNLMTLILDQNLLTDVDPLWLGNPPLLSELNLTGNQLEVLTRSSLRGLRGLRILRLNKNRIRTISTFAFTDLTNLTELDLSENRLTAIPLEGFRSLKSTSMRLDGNPWDCSCSAQDFIDFLKDLRRRSLLLMDTEVRCGSPPALERQPVWNVSACETTASSQPETSVQSRPTPSPPPPSQTKTPTDILKTTLTLSAVTTPLPSRPPSETKTPTDILKTTHTLNSCSVSSRPPPHADIVPTLIAVIVVLSTLLCVLCFLALIYRRKRKSKTVMPRLEKEENAEVEDAHVHSEKTDWTEDPHRGEERRWFPGVRAKSANAILSTSAFGASGKDQITVQTEVEDSSENTQETDEGKRKEAETAQRVQTENLIESSPDENTHYCTSLNILENVPYLSIGTQRNNPNRQPGQRSQVGKGMQRVSTWPPTAAQWQERRKTKGEDETGGVDAFAAWMQRESLKILDAVKNVEQEVQKEKSDMEPRARTQDGLKMNDCITLNHPPLPKPNSCGEPLSVHETCSSVCDDPNQTDPSPDQEELQTPHLEQAGTSEQKANTDSMCTEAEGTKGSDVKTGGGSRRRGGARSTGSKGPSGGGGSPDDDTLLYGNQYAAMDLLHEVVQNNGRWTRERWRQVQTNKQKGLTEMHR